ncbi:hypothetical protein H5V43_03475 [Sphingobium fuliginis]|jgi:hypothetical protein|uniref:Uncharacterized protein n=1 Tax=Sphingobium fuliginis (strain ATCC 27551) TaxID=336203 RepID=A0A7M2GKP0_SPHSA|nr:hypothetical protein [Sphingobium fuliginis]EXS70312.1 hypothetical protein BF95_26125 [Sphingobium sp. Ant17]QOT73301.1 hypothetical protein H5V43_03475 [Sphingobium fuliginis]
MGMDTLAMAQRLGTVRQAELAANLDPTQSRHRAVGTTVWGAGGISPEIAGLLAAVGGWVGHRLALLTTRGAFDSPPTAEHCAISGPAFRPPNWPG